MQGEEKNIPREKEKIATLLLAVVVIGVAGLGPTEGKSVGIFPHAGMMQRCIYPFFHANIFHALLNSWCLISVVFAYQIRFGRLLMAYLIAASIPIDSLSAVIPFSTIPTVGLSGIVLFLFGSISMEVARRVFYQLWMLSFLAVGFLVSGTNAYLHLYCYLCGIIYAILNCPISVCKRR